MFKTFLKIKLVVGALIAAVSFFGGAFAARSVSAESSGIAVQYDLFSAGFAGNTFSASDVFTPTIYGSPGEYFVDLNNMVQINYVNIVEREGQSTLYTIEGSSEISINGSAFDNQYGLVTVTFRVYTRTEESNYEDFAPTIAFTYIYCGKSEYLSTQLSVGQWLYDYITAPIPEAGHTGYLNYVAITAVEAYDQFETTNYSPYISIISDNRLIEVVPAQMTIYGADTPGSGLDVDNRLNFESALIIPGEIYDATNETNSLYYNAFSGYNFAFIRSPSLTYGYVLSQFNLGQPAPYNLTCDGLEIQYGDKTVNYSVTLKPQSGFIQTPARGSDEYEEFIKSMHLVMNNAPNAPPDAPPVTPTPEPEPEPEPKPEPKPEVPPNDFATWLSVGLLAIFFPVLIIPIAISAVITGDPLGDILSLVNATRSVLVGIGDFFAPIINWIVDTIGRIFDAIVRIITEIPDLIDNVVDPPFNFILFFAILAAIIITIAIILKKRR